MTGWREALAWAGVVAALAASPARAMELWRGAQPRMSHAQVGQLFPGARRPDAVTRLAGPDVGDLAAPVDLAGHPARATFYFVKDALWDVVVNVDSDASLETAKAIAGQIDQDLGRRRHCEATGDEGARRYDCAWPTAGNRLARLSYAESPGGPPLLSIVFRPADRQAANADADAQINASRTRVRDDAFSQFIQFDSPEEFHNPFGGDITHWGLCSGMERSTGLVVHQLCLSVLYNGGAQRRYTSATDNSADTLQVFKLGHSSTRCKDCLRDEIVGVIIDQDKLIAGLSHPYQVKIRAESGDWLIVSLSPAMIRGQLLAIAAHGGPPVPGDDQEVSPLPLNFGATLETVAAKANAPAGVKADAVTDDGVFAAAGVRRGDVLTALDGAALSDAAAAATAIAAIPPGRRVWLTLVRGGRPMTLQAQF